MGFRKIIFYILHDLKVGDFMKKYGELISKIRIKNGDTREDLAKKLGIPNSTFAKYERGERKVTPELMENIAEIYDVPVATLFGEEVEIPEEFKKIGVKWMRVIDKFEKQNLTPEQVEATVEFLNKMGLTDFKN
jgi:transcriptional regulator with XRE-family HTH domain